MKNYKLKNNQIKIFSLISLSLFLSILFLPFFSQAALVPCGRDGQGMCTLCHLIIGIKGLIDYGMNIMVFVAIIMIVISGIIYIISSGDEGMMGTAKGLLKNTLIGFALILGAWLIVNTTMWILGTRNDLGIQKQGWTNFSCSTVSRADQNQSTNQSNNQNNRATNPQNATSGQGNCGSNNMGRCYPASSWFSACLGMTSVSGGNDCPSGQWCCR